MKQIILALLAITLAAGCTTTETMYSFGLSSADRIEPGSTAVVELMDGSSEKVEILTYGATSLDVVDSDDITRSIDYADIMAVHARQVDGKKTFGLFATALLVVGLSNALDDIAFFPAGPPGL